MRILVLGAGATGGYFFGRLAATGADVTFLVRPRRAEVLARDGLRIRSRYGDADLVPQVATAENLAAGYDLAVIACKAFDLDEAIASIRPAVDGRTAVLPLLNGMRHLDRLVDAFGGPSVLGGTCHIASTLSAGGEILHLNEMQRIRFGERDGSRSARVAALAELFARTALDAAASDTIVQEMWEKWFFLATLAAATTTMRASVGDILESPDGAAFLDATLGACIRIATAEGHAPRESALALARKYLSERGSPFTASILRDLERGADRIEGEHIVGDMLARARRHGIAAPNLEIANIHLQAYLARRKREHPPR